MQELNLLSSDDKRGMIYFQCLGVAVLLCKERHEKKKKITSLAIYWTVQTYEKSFLFLLLCSGRATPNGSALCLHVTLVVRNNSL
jgi:hypothetical protein